MIKTGIYLHSAITGEVSLLNRIEIWNDATGTPTRGNYRFRIFGKRGKLIAEGELKDFPRRSYTSVELLKRCLNSVKTR
jgi:hypothetical protein